jgi:hypothetical protein
VSTLKLAGTLLLRAISAVRVTYDFCDAAIEVIVGGSSVLADHFRPPPSVCHSAAGIDRS